MSQKLLLVFIPIVIALCIQAKTETPSNDLDLDAQENGVQMKLLGRVGKKIYYRSVGGELTWINSLQFCRSCGLQLGSIQSETEQEGINNLLKHDHLCNGLWSAGIRYFDVFTWLSSFTALQIGLSVNQTTWKIMNAASKFMSTNLEGILGSGMTRDVIIFRKLSVKGTRYPYPTNGNNTLKFP